MGSGFGIVSLLCGIGGIVLPLLSIFSFYIPFGGLIAVSLSGLAIIFGIIGIVKDDSKAPGIIGLILGIIGVVLYVMLFVLVVAFLANLLNP